VLVLARTSWGDEDFNDRADWQFVPTAVHTRGLTFCFQKHPPCLVGMEACASSHYWSRELQALGHTVRLMPPSYVKL
jgi:transposase